MEHEIEIKGLKVKYGAHEAVVGIDMNIARGSITAVIGSNGAGKTTIINAISGVVRYEGMIYYRGEALPAKAHKVVKKGIVQVPEGRKIFAGLTVEENLIAGAYCVRKKKEVTELLEQQYAIFPRLGERKWQDAGNLVRR